jgi:hypothetical protein
MRHLVTMAPRHLVGRWSVRSQEAARRNAMAACTVLAARRLERLEVEAYVAQCLAQRTTAAPVSLEGVG